MPPENETLDNYVSNSFNTKNLNPAYIFILPDKNNRTIVLRKNDFLEIDYPNISHINKFRKMQKDFYNKKDENEMKEKLIENMYSDDSDSKSMEMVAENMRTERNFYKWVEDYNNDVESFTNRPSKKFQSRKSDEDYELYDDDYETSDEEKETSEENDRVRWDDFGLKGWTGGLKKVREEYKIDIER